MTPNTSVPSRSKPWLWIAASAFLFALFAFAAACNGDDDDNGDDGGSDSPTATADAADDGDSGGDDDSGGDGSTLGDRIRDISNDYEFVAAKVVYDFTASGAGGEDFDTQLTLVTRPPSDSRMEFSTDEGTVIAITTSDATYSCSSVGGQEFCLGLPVEDSDLSTLPLFADFTDVDLIRDIADAEADVDIDEFDDTIAGEDVDCFRTTGDIDGDVGEGSWCFTDDGILLLASFSGTTLGVESTFEMRATSFDRNVSDSDFEPPYDTLDLGDLEGLGDLFD